VVIACGLDVAIGAAPARSAAGHVACRCEPAAKEAPAMTSRQCTWFLAAAVLTLVAALHGGPGDGPNGFHLALVVALVALTGATAIRLWWLSRESVIRPSSPLLSLPLPYVLVAAVAVAVCVAAAAGIGARTSTTDAAVQRRNAAAQDYLARVFSAEIPGFRRLDPIVALGPAAPASIAGVPLPPEQTNCGNCPAHARVFTLAGKTVDFVAPASWRSERPDAMGAGFCDDARGVLDELL
jgi:hypothetical protein